PRLVLRRPGDQHLAQRADALGAPAAPPYLLDLVVEVGLVEHEVAERLAGLEPRQGLEHRLLVVGCRRARRRVAQLDRLSVRGADAERDGFTGMRLDSHVADGTHAADGQSRKSTYSSTEARSRGTGSRTGAPKCSSASTRSPCGTPIASRPRAVRSTPGVRQYDARPRSVAASSTSMIAAAVAQT